VQEYLEEHEEVTFDIFLEKIWDNIHEIYRRPEEDTKETETDSAASETPDVSLCYVDLLLGYMWHMIKMQKSLNDTVICESCN